MKLFHISQTYSNDYDTFDSAVVAADSEDEARNLHPRGAVITDWTDASMDWATRPEQVVVKYLGEAAPGVVRGVVCASFNAG